jgi:hypothetical protein
MQKFGQPHERNGTLASQAPAFTAIHVADQICCTQDANAESSEAN